MEQYGFDPIYEEDEKKEESKYCGKNNTLIFKLIYFNL